jgi:CheY-like chemotaxis protein
MQPKKKENGDGYKMKKIMVVDDRPDDLQSMNQILSKAGYDIITANDGSEALKKLETTHVDLMLIDIMMPNLSGLDLLRLLRERLNHNISVVFVSIKPEKEVDVTSVDGFVQKPFTPQTLISTINKTIQESASP